MVSKCVNVIYMFYIGLEFLFINVINVLGRRSMVYALPL